LTKFPEAYNSVQNTIKRILDEFENVVKDIKQNNAFCKAAEKLITEIEAKPVVKNLPRPNIIGNTEAEKIEILLNCKYIQFDEQYLRDLVRHVKSEVWYDLHAACPLVDEVFLDCYENAIFERREILHATKQRKELTLAEGKKLKKWMAYLR